MLEKKPANEYYQLLHYCHGQYEPRQNNIDLESARETLMKEDDKMVAKRRFESRKNLMEVNSNPKNEETPENEEIFIYGFTHNKRDIIDNFILIGCESKELYENDKLFNFWSDKSINKEIEKRFQDNGITFYDFNENKHFFSNSKCGLLNTVTRIETCACARCILGHCFKKNSLTHHVSSFWW